MEGQLRAAHDLVAVSLLLKYSRICSYFFQNNLHQSCRERQIPLLTKRETDSFIDNLLVQIHLIIEMILVDRPCALRV